MRGERFLFYLTITFICGNLLTEYLTRAFSQSDSLFLTLLNLSTVLALLLLFSLFKLRSTALYLLTFFLLGSLLVTQDRCIGGYHSYSLSQSETISNVRSKFDNYLDEIISPNEAEVHSILKALTMGDSKEIPRQLKDSFRKSGAMHILSLSGLHVGVLYKFITALFVLLGGGIYVKIIRGVTVIPALWFFAIFTGASPSICRAVIMATVYEIGQITGRENNGLNSLAISALIITLINPSAPSSVSFQLSFISMIGIFTLFPLIDKIIQVVTKSRILQKIWSVAALTISCQIATTPLTLCYFGSFSIFSLLTNILAVPISSVVMIIIPITLMGHEIPFVGDILSSALHISIVVMNWIIDIIGQLA